MDEETKKKCAKFMADILSHEYNKIADEVEYCYLLGIPFGIKYEDGLKIYKLYKINK